MKEKIIKVSTANRMLFIKGKLSRTPLEVIVKNEAELNMIKTNMIHQGINFTIEDYEKPIKKIKSSAIKNIVSTKKDTSKKKITNPKTILEKMSVEDDE